MRGNRLLLSMRAAGAGTHGARQRQGLADRAGAAIRGAARRRERQRRRGGRRARHGRRVLLDADDGRRSPSAAWARPTSAATAAPSWEWPPTRAASPGRDLAARGGVAVARLVPARRSQPATRRSAARADTSRDGKVVVGLAWDGCSIAHAFRWEESTGMVDLGSSVAGQSQSRGRRVGRRQGRGRLPGGRDRFHPGRAVGGRPAGAVHGTRWPGGTAKAANIDGSIVVGRVCNPAAAQAKRADLSKRLGVDEAGRREVPARPEAARLAWPADHRRGRARPATMAA